MADWEPDEDCGGLTTDILGVSFNGNHVTLAIGLMQTIYFALKYDDIRQIKELHASETNQLAGELSKKRKRLYEIESIMYDKVCDLECYEPNPVKAQQAMISPRVQLRESSRSLMRQLSAYQCGLKNRIKQEHAKESIKQSTIAYAQGMILERSRANQSRSRKLQAYSQVVGYNIPNFTGYGYLANAYNQRSLDYANGVNTGLTTIGTSYSRLVEQARTIANKEKEVQQAAQQQPLVRNSDLVQQPGELRITVQNADGTNGGGGGGFFFQERTTVLDRFLNRSPIDVVRNNQSGIRLNSG